MALLDGVIPMVQRVFRVVFLWIGLSFGALAAPLLVPSLPAEGTELVVLHETFSGAAWLGYRVSFPQPTDITTLVTLRSASPMMDGQITIFYERANDFGNLMPGGTFSSMQVEKSWTRVLASVEPLGVQVLTPTPPLYSWDELHELERGVRIVNATRDTRIVVMAAGHASSEIEVEVIVTAVAPVLLRASASGPEVVYASRQGGFSPLATTEVRAPLVGAAAEIAGAVDFQTSRGAYFLAMGYMDSCLCTFHGDASYKSPFQPVPYPTVGPVTASGYNRPPGERRLEYVASTTTDIRDPVATAINGPIPGFMPTPIGLRFIGADVPTL